MMRMRKEILTVMMLLLTLGSIVYADDVNISVDVTSTTTTTTTTSAPLHFVTMGIDMRFLISIALFAVVAIVLLTVPTPNLASMIRKIVLVFLVLGIMAAIFTL